jgi:hypothetical protein
VIVWYSDQELSSAFMISVIVSGFKDADSDFGTRTATFVPTQGTTVSWDPPNSV